MLRRLGLLLLLLCAHHRVDVPSAARRSRVCLLFAGSRVRAGLLFRRCCCCCCRCWASTGTGRVDCRLSRFPIKRHTVGRKSD
uniref:Putative secreted protein n=1 Tax=Anopheles darlingi TaxID=43151 RepID=A0A2M4D5H0_ANODA